MVGRMTGIKPNNLYHFYGNIKHATPAVKVSNPN